MAGNFGEKSGIIYSASTWGRWGQTIEDVQIFVDVAKGTSPKEIKCKIGSKTLSIIVKGKTVLEGNLYGTVVADECLWTLEDRKELRVTLVKVNRDASNCWKALLDNQYPVDPWTLNEMEKKLVLERFQNENPGFDFSKSDISGNFHGGGPQLPGQ
eukprot:Seg338.3 transcript_id=Seg338.3/GoldUCD/mRNA.D3Y31 product="NudC domain-containing protein 2" protein_id=Seg338.3/GoldUCD/D3Y31